MNAAADWIEANQLARRNLTPDQRAVALGNIYNRRKGKRGGDHKSKGQDDTLIYTAESVAKEYGVSAATVKRAGKLAERLKLPYKTKLIDLPDRSGAEARCRSSIKAYATMQGWGRKEVANIEVILLWATRRMGELLKQTRGKGQQGGDRKSSSAKELDPPLASLGVTKKQKSAPRGGWGSYWNQGTSKLGRAADPAAVLGVLRKNSNSTPPLRSPHSA